MMEDKSFITTDKEIDYAAGFKVKAPEVIVELLIKMIRSRKLENGDKLPSERELCQLMEVSRPCLREAIRALQLMGVIDIRHGSGMYIKQMDPEKIMSYLDIAFILDESMYDGLFETRYILEPAAARIAAKNITDEQLDEIEKNILLSVKEVENAKVFMHLDYSIHNTIVCASGNRILQTFVQSLVKPNLYAREITNQNKDLRKQTLVDHERIYNGLKTHNPQMAEEAMKMHINNVEKTFRMFSKEIKTGY